MLWKVAKFAGMCLLVATLCVVGLTKIYGDSKGLAASRAVVDTGGLALGAVLGFTPEFFQMIAAGQERVQSSSATPNDSKKSTKTDKSGASTKTDKGN